ncbi:MAG: hypothetical protein AAB426_05115 [Myxococcota bacterium]
MRFENMTEKQRRDHEREEGEQLERERYTASRAAAITALASAGATTMQLDQAARLLPEHPEWRRYAPRGVRRTKGAS